MPIAGRSYFYLLEEFVDGGSLSSRLEAGTLLPSEVKALGAQLMTAVAHLAQLDLVHRDLKPDNIMYKKGSGDPVIVDFGVVRNLTDTSLTGTWAMHGPGTPLFAAPEQLNNQKELIDWRTDQFALGIVLSYCSVGYHPYSRLSESNGTIVDNVLRRRALAPRFENDVSSLGLVTLLRMVSAWPVQRFTRPQQMISAWNQ